MPPRVVVTGVGIISSLGRGLPDHQRMLLNEQAALGPCTLPETIYAREFPFGEVRLSNDELAFPAGIPAEGNSRTTLLGCIAAAEAIAQSGLTSPLLHRGALINASTVGGMCEVEKYYFDMLNEPEAFTAYTDTLDCADCSIRIAKRFGIQGFITTISTACSSSANALMLGARMLEQKKVPVAICGGTDALTRFTINGFNALKNIDRQACRPFDAGRNGLNLGEGAAYLVLEREEDALSRGARILAIFS
ncbi:MAG TPA: beta-ketoacyl synthase N-terminal-like domain-containing protein, partial [Chitinophagaceae bacterium]|nr:beta-ketoacyl synthase N-terminal-like domain-containing protein [Chitinophagaceae bacterium]